MVALTASGAATVSGDYAMFGLIRELVRFLSQDLLSVEDMVGRVDPIVNDPGGLMPIELRPRFGRRSATTSGCARIAVGRLRLFSIRRQSGHGGRSR